jgi:DNA modification methylase
MTKPVIIGDATLYLGDCLEILPTLPKVDAVITDPPYGHNNNNGDLIHKREQALGIAPKRDEAEARPIANDGPEANELFRRVLPLLNDALLSGGCCCCCCCGGGGGPDPQFARWSLWMDEVFDFKQMIVWDKGPMGMGWHYRRSYETVLVAQKRGGACKWYDQTDRVENVIRPSQYGIRKIIPQIDDHPTPKPPELAAHFARLHSLGGETVLDPFMGHGWVGVAVLPMGRRFIGIEIDPAHFEQACIRVENAQRQLRLIA